MNYIIENYNYWLYVVIMMIGLYAMIAKRNYLKKLIGMSIFQTAIILFYISIGSKKGATIPILDHHMMESGHGFNPDMYANPLPHVLMLTAIVVGVATLGVGLAVVQKIYGIFGSIEETSILESLKKVSHD